MKKANIGFCLLSLLYALIIQQCTPEPPPPKKLEFSSVTLSKSKATIGETINLGWSYNNENKLSRHVIYLMFFRLSGLGADSVVIGNNDRNFSFVFIAPTTVMIKAYDTEGGVINVAFDVRLNDDFFFRVTDLTQTNFNYPRLGAGKSINFNNFLGIFENTNGNAEPEDGVIDEIANDPIGSSIMSRDNSFFARSFDVNESSRFGFKLGSAFPFLDAGFLATTEGIPFLGTPKADIVIFAGGIAYSGNVFNIKADDGEFQGVENVAGNFEPIFCAIDYRSDNAGLNLFLSDIHICNTIQGLVLSRFHGFTANRSSGTYTNPLYSFPPGGGGTGIISGSLQNFTVGFNVTQSDGNIIGEVYAGLSISYNVPFFPDDNIGGRILK